MSKIQPAIALWFEEVGRGDVGRVGGKNASLGEMIGTLVPRGIDVPPGFATTADAYWRFIDENNLRETVASAVEAYRSGAVPLAETGKLVRTAILKGSWPQDMADTIARYHSELLERVGAPDAGVAVRSSATAEDLPDASFAGQQETFLNIKGGKALLNACTHCYASLFTDRAISYREAKGFDHMSVALSIGVQLMVRADTGGPDY